MIFSTSSSASFSPMIFLYPLTNSDLDNCPSPLLSNALNDFNNSSFSYFVARMFTKNIQVASCNLYPALKVLKQSKVFNKVYSSATYSLTNRFIHGCYNTSPALILLTGSYSSIFFIRSLPSYDTLSNSGIFIV